MHATVLHDSRLFTTSLLPGTDRSLLADRCADTPLRLDYAIKPNQACNGDGTNNDTSNDRSTTADQFTTALANAC